MIDGLSLDQLRIFAAAVDGGSFSAAARRLGRTQSAVSESIANLEAQLGFALFDRGGRYPRLTTEGSVLLADVRSVVAGVDVLKARARGIAGGLEAELTVVIDVFFPMPVFAEIAHEFRASYPATPLRLYVEALGATLQPVVESRAGFGLVGPMPTVPAGLTAERVARLDLVMVVAATHPLAAYGGRVPKAVLADHVQIILTDRSDTTANREIGVMSPTVWRLADLFAKHAFLVSGLGWGSMPVHIVSEDLEEGRLVRLSIEDLETCASSLPMSAVYRTAEPPGPAGRWMIERLKQCPIGVASGTSATTRSP